MKTKLVICMKDEKYKQRFVKCVMKHYKELFEMYVVSQMDELLMEKNENIGAVIIGDDNDMELKFPQKHVCLILKEGVGSKFIGTNENVYYTEKFQEVYKIIEELQRVISENIYVASQSLDKGTIQKIGVFSLTKEVMQMPFVALLAEILGENHRVLVVDLQAFSGFAQEIETEEVLGMEDLISIASSENYTRNRLVASIGREQKWEYIYPVKNTSCLAEVGVEIYQNMLEILEKEQMYTHVILNFGSIFSGMVELMESCQQMYILTEKQDIRNYREDTFLEEMNRRGKDTLLKRISWMEIPMGMVRISSWKQIAKQWLWSSLGDQLRERYWMEYTNGTDM